MRIAQSDEKSMWRDLLKIDPPANAPSDHIRLYGGRDGKIHAKRADGSELLASGGTNPYVEIKTNVAAGGQTLIEARAVLSVWGMSDIDPDGYNNTSTDNAVPVLSNGDDPRLSYSQVADGNQYKAFDNDPLTRFAFLGTPHHIQWRFDAPTIINKIGYGGIPGGQTPYRLRLLGSNTGGFSGEEVALFDRTVTWDGAVGEVEIKWLHTTNGVPYHYYRLWLDNGRDNDSLIGYQVIMVAVPYTFQWLYPGIDYDAHINFSQVLSSPGLHIAPDRQITIINKAATSRNLVVEVIK